MLSARAKGWRWYDWIVLFVVVIFISVIVQAVAPTSGFAHALHTVWHAVALGIGLLGNGLVALAQLLNQL